LGVQSTLEDLFKGAVRNLVKKTGEFLKRNFGNVSRTNLEEGVFAKKRGTAAWKSHSLECSGDSRGTDQGRGGKAGSKTTP